MVPLFLIGIVVMVALLVIVLLLTGYVKAPPDQAIIISGINKHPRVLVGRAGFKFPFFERTDRLYLGQISVDIKTAEYIPTKDFINVKVDAVAKVRVTEDPNGMLRAERNFLNKTPEEIAFELEDSLQGNMREIIGTLSLTAINTDRDSFSDQVMEKASKDMEKLGIEILSCNIQNVTDEHGLISDLGMDNTSKIKKDAAIAKAESDKETAIAQAKAKKETDIARAQAIKEANDVEVQTQTDIAIKQNELALKQSELKTKADIAKAKADAAYAIQEQEQQRTIQTATVNAQIARTERETELKERQVQVTEQELAATIKKKADADRYATEQAAAADLEREKRDAEAKRYAMEQDAEAIRTKGDAVAATIRAKGIAEAEAARARGEAEAAAIRAKGIAEAEALEQHALALQKMNQAGMIQMLIEVMPQIAGEIAKPLSNIGNISIYDSGNAGEGGMEHISGAVPVVIKQLFDTMSSVTGVDMREIMRAQTYDAKVNHNLTVSGDMTDIINNAEKKAQRLDQEESERQ